MAPLAASVGAHIFVPMGDDAGAAEAAARAAGPAAAAAPSPVDVFTALHPVYVASRVFGMAPLRVARSTSAARRRRLEFSLPAFFYGLLVLLATVPPMLAGLSIDLYNYVSHKKTVRMKNMTSVVATLADLLSLLATAAVSVLHAIARGRRLVTLAASLHDVDATLLTRLPEGAPRLDASNRSLRRRVRLLLGAAYAHLALMFLFDVLVWESVTGHLPLIYLPTYGLYVLMVTFELQFVAALWCVRQRFALINELLAAAAGAGAGRARGPNPAHTPTPSPTRRLALIKRIFSAQQRSLLFRRRRVSDAGYSAGSVRAHSGYGGAGRSPAASCGGASGRPRSAATMRRLGALSELHARLCATVADLNAAYGLPLLVHVLSLFLHLIITPYFFLLDLLYPVTYGNTDPAFLFLQLCWIVTHVGKLFLVVQPCAAACEEARKTGLLVSQLLSAGFDTEVKKQLELFALQLVHRRTEISACGFCKVDFPLIASIAGSVTTYLVILIQFQNSDEEKVT